MTAANFPAALKLVLVNEGGYADDPRDPGGATNHGITQATYTAWLKSQGRAPHPVRQIAPAEVEAIYRTRFWDVVCGDDLPAGVDLAVFDYAVNSGPSTAAKCLQRCIGAAVDGAIGKLTLDAAKAQHPVTLINAYSARRLSLLERLRTWRVFGKGWRARVQRVQAAALKLA